MLWLLHTGRRPPGKRSNSFDLVDEQTREAMDKRLQMPEITLKLERLAARWEERKSEFPDCRLFCKIGEAQTFKAPL